MIKQIKILSKTRGQMREIRGGGGRERMEKGEKGEGRGGK